MMDLLAYDGETSLLNIADRLNIPAWELYQLIDKLESLKLIVKK